MNEVEAIVGKYGGDCFECGPVSPSYVPFADLLKDTMVLIVNVP
jgi:hypothetical protein